MSWKIGDRDASGRVVLRIDPIVGDPDFGSGYEVPPEPNPQPGPGPRAVETLRAVEPDLVSELETLLSQARTGDLRGLLFVAYRQGTVDHRYGNVGEYSLADFALGVKLLELELDSIVTRGQEPDE
jgi:hypothetical protein